MYLQKRGLFPPLIDKNPENDLNLVIVIPCHDEPDLLSSLEALRECELQPGSTEVIVIINCSVSSSPETKAANLKTYYKTNAWANKNSIDKLRFYPLLFDDLPQKHAGVGLARKIGMDEGVARFEKAGIVNGIIACFDADSGCTPNYLLSIYNHFNNNPKIQACSIYFEHPLAGDEFDDNVYAAIASYELHLRYYINAQRYAGYPFAFQTIGSSMAVRADAYQKQGGMNRRQAGEDFYFLHKFISIGKLDELNSTTVFPSPRPSQRVPFGTGKAVDELLHSGNGYQTYNPKIFEDLKLFLQQVKELYACETIRHVLGWSKSLPESFTIFLQNQDFYNKVMEIKAHTAGRKTFTDRLFQWFNAFLLMKYIHFARDHYYPNIPVDLAAIWLLETTDKLPVGAKTDARSLLIEFRRLDRQGLWSPPS
ncbi:MAG: glycosyltransferase family 2 protein [Bacteroidota bacterium]